jgi:Na+/proline symporter
LSAFSDPLSLVVFVAVTAVLCVLLSPRVSGTDGFFAGRDEAGRAPGLWTLVLSQVTTWIFARSLLNAAILGFYYGIAGVLAYTAYYASFLTGAMIVDHVRFHRGAESLQDFLRDRFGRPGVACYNGVVALRLMSEVFANLLVVGVIFTSAFPDQSYAQEIAIAAVALTGLGYSMMGGLRASLRTDVAQMLLFLVVLLIAAAALIASPEFSFARVLAAQGVSGPAPGWILLAVAGLQVLSYPAHDPVMIDRGFLADRRTTRNSFLHAFWLSAGCIFLFGLFGAQAGLLATAGEEMGAVWMRMLSPAVIFCLNAALLVSAMSTLDSTLSSAARLAIIELRFGSETAASGRIAMALFMLGGLLFLLAGTDDLYAAVAVSGTASMFLAPVILFSLFGGRDVPLWSFLVAFAAAMVGAALYFFNGHPIVQATTGNIHKYTLLLWICGAVLFIGCTAFALGAAIRSRLVPVT